MTKYDKAFAELERMAGGASTRCSELCRLLQKDFRFRIKEIGKAGHKVFDHPGLPAWPGSNFDCGHGNNPTVKPVYIRNVKRIVSQFEDELRAIIDEE